MVEERCGSEHKHGPVCIRRKGHDGRCWGRVYLSPTGEMTRAEWYSENGVFVRHYGYITSYTRPRRANR